MINLAGGNLGNYQPEHHPITKEAKMDFHLSEEQRLWRKAVHAFVSKEIKPLAQEINEREEIPRAVIKKMGPMGLLGMSVKESTEDLTWMPSVRQSR